MFALTFLVVIQVVYSYEVFEEAPLPDFDEIFDAEAGEGKPGIATDYELERLRRVPRIAEGDSATKVMMVPNEIRSFPNEADFVFETRKQKYSRELFQLKNVGAALSNQSEKNPNSLFVSKNYMGDRNLFRSPTSLVDINGDFEIVTPLATPYMRNDWGSKLLRNFRA